MSQLSTTKELELLALRVYDGAMKWLRRLDWDLIKQILKLSWPIVMANALQSAYQLTDTFWVGRIGANAVAALSLCYPIFFLLLSMGIGFSIAGAVLISQYKGVGDQKSINHIASQAIGVMAIFGLFISLVGFLSAELIIDLIGVEGEVHELATSYLKIAMFGMTFQYVYLSFQNTLRAVGNVQKPLNVVLLTVVINFILDPILIKGWGPFPALGVDGAAYSTVFTQALAALIGLSYMGSGQEKVQIHLRDIIPIYSDFKKIFKLAVPTSLEGSTRALSMNAITFLVAGFGSEVVAVFGIGVRILSFVVIPALGFSQACSVLVGNHVGKGDNEKAFQVARYGLGIIFFGLSFFGVFFFIFAAEAVGVFVPNDPAVIERGAVFIKIFALTFGIVGLQQVANGVFRGAGNTLLAMMVAIVTLWVFRFPLAYILSHHTRLDELGIWWAFSLSNIAAGIISLLIYQRKDWVRRQVGKS